MLPTHNTPQDELDVASEKIRELISTLDARKDEAIERTFKGVAKHFREVFADLVPGGSGDMKYCGRCQVSVSL
jgi:structural maintenance of chromosome 3 (chondroitin sulfate proteoglycan 6)